MTGKFKSEGVDENGPKEEKIGCVLGQEDIQELLKQADLTEKDLRSDKQEEWRLQALVYRDLIWELANIFVDKREEWSTEMTHSEFIRNPETGEVKSLYLCLEFMDKIKYGELADQSYEKFRQFLEENPKVIPEELRKKFEVYVGFNYGDQGGILIKEKEIEMVPQNVLDDIMSDGPIGICREEDKFTDLLAEKLRGKFV